MFSHSHIRSALLSSLAALLLLLTSAGTPRANVRQATISSSATAGGAQLNAATPTPKPPPCARASFDPNNFPATPTFNNPFYPLVPGTQFILEGYVNNGTTRQPHQVVFTVTDLTKMIDGVRTVVLWDRDFDKDQFGNTVLREEELAFHAEDTSGTPWNLGEYPALYDPVTHQFTGAPDTWISGLPSAPGQFPAQGGTIFPGNPQQATPPFLQAYAEPGVILDCGQVKLTDQHICNTIRCYDHVLIIEETSPPDPGTQLKYYAPGVGNFQIDPTTGDPIQETLVLSQTVRLSVADCIAARNAALALEDRAYNNDNTQSVYKLTRDPAYSPRYSPMEQTGLCESPTATPTGTPPTGTPPTATPTGTPTATPIPTPALHSFLPVAAKAGLQIFDYTGAPQQFTVPAGVTTIRIDAYGAQGGAGSQGEPDAEPGPPELGGRGGFVRATIAVVPGETLYIYVGGAGRPGPFGIGGFNGGGKGAVGDTNTGGGGGGASDVRRGGATLDNRVVVAAGGGGGGGAPQGGSATIVGGVGGGLAGGKGATSPEAAGGGGGTQTAGGAGGAGGGPGFDGAPGTFGAGGAGGSAGLVIVGGGGGGGGYYGGGGGEASSGANSGGGGGGGSSFTAPGATGVTHTQGPRNGNGLVTITW